MRKKVGTAWASIWPTCQRPRAPCLIQGTETQNLDASLIVKGLKPKGDDKKRRKHESARNYVPNTHQKNRWSPFPIKMAAKLSLATTIGLSFLLLLLIPASLFFFLSNSSIPARLLSFSPCLSVASTRDRPLKVYMYDLPSRFNLAMLSPSPASGSDGNTSNDDLPFPPWPDGSGIKRQHSVEYWMTGSLVSRDERQGDDGIGVVRVRNGDEADVFFVPFFSSMSFNVHGHNMTDPDTEIDRQLQVHFFSLPE